MKFVKITKENIDFAVKIHNEIFIYSTAKLNYEESLDSNTNNYYLIYNEDNNCIGIIGLYVLENDPESAWLGWFGIREPFRRQHYGTKAIQKIEEIAKERGYKYLRLYTDMRDNDDTLQFYISNDYKSEIYLNLDDEASIAIEVLVFSKSLSDNPLVPWNHRNMHLTEQLLRQMK